MLQGVAVQVGLVGSDCMPGIAAAVAIQNELDRFSEGCPDLPDHQVAALAVDQELVLQLVVLLGRGLGRKRLERLQVLKRARGAVVVSSC